MSENIDDLIKKTGTITINVQDKKEALAQDNDDITPNRGRFFSSMNYKEYVTKFDKPPARPQILPQQGEIITDNPFSLDVGETHEPQTRSYSRSVPMRPLELSGSSSLKSNTDQKTIEEEDEESFEDGSLQEVPIFPIDELPKDNNIVTTIRQNNEVIRNRSQSENFSKVSIFSFCSGPRHKKLSYCE